MYELQQQMAGTEQSRSQSIAAIAKAGRELSRSGRQLRKTRVERKRLEAELADASSQAEQLATRLQERRARIADWLRRHYRNGHDARLADFLVSRDPNQLARDGVYLQRIGQANLEILQQQRDDIARAAQLASQIAQRRGALAELEGQQQKERRALRAKRRDYRRQLAALDSQAREQKREAASLKLDGKRLERLIAGLERIAREREARRAAKAEQGHAGADDGQEPSAASGSPSSQEPVVARIRRHAGKRSAGVPFKRLRGKLDAPLKGDVIGRFGRRRVDGGPVWKGVFIRAPEGEEVRAVAAGEVVFADWLRGFGNLVIVDHDGGYMSIYGNNDILIGALGDRVVGGETIASVGVGGNSRESGLYFEIRHRGEAVDPMRWIRLR